MIRIYHNFLASAVCYAFFATALHANCAVFAALDRVHYLQQVLQDRNGPMPADMAVRHLSVHVNALDDGSILQAVSEHPASDAPQVFANYIRNTRTLIKNTVTVSNRVIPIHFETSRVQSNFDIAGAYLSDLRCAGPVGGASFQAAVSELDAAPLAVTDSDLFHKFWALHNVILLIIGLLTAAVIAHGIRTYAVLRRRRRQRYPCSYETVVRCDGVHSENCTVIDISMNGGKLRRRAYLAVGGRVEIRLLDEWCEGTVVWSNTHYSGVVFSQSLSKQTIRSLRAPEPLRVGPSNAQGRPPVSTT